MTISLVVAAAENNSIGKNNQLLWHLPNDLKFFKNTTWGMPVIMGRKTFEAVNKPLPGRFNIVITRQSDWQADGVIVAADLEDALQKAAETNCKEIFIIGGGEIYSQSILLADQLDITRVHHSFEADVFFPEIDLEIWELTTEVVNLKDEKHPYDYSFQTFVRKK